VSKHPVPTGLPDDDETWEMRVDLLSRRLAFPPTPDIAGQVRARLDRPRMRAGAGAIRAAAVAAIALLLAVLLIPDLRSRALDFLQIGAVRFVESPTGTPAATESPLWPLAPGALPSVLDLPGETTLDAARQAAPFPIRLPAYPPDLGPPDRVFVPTPDGATVALAWLEPGDPGAVRLSLYALGPGNLALKFEAPIEGTSVGGHPALWVTEPHVLVIPAGPGEPLRLAVTTPVLIWEQDSVTYRLEGNLTLDDARRIAESLE